MIIFLFVGLETVILIESSQERTLNFNYYFS